MLSDFLIVMLTGMTSVTVIANLSAWFGYRHAETALVSEDKVPPPSIPGSCLSEIVMLLGIVTAGGVFCLFNPLGR